MAIKLDDRVKQLISNLSKVIEADLRRSLVKKGHKDTGRLLQSIEVLSKQEANRLILEGLFEEYGAFQDTGTRPGKLRNIGALEEWVRRKLSVPASEALGVAFAISKTHAKIGMHSKKGRTNKAASGWMTEALKEKDSFITSQVDEAFGVQVEATIDNIIRDFK